MHIAELRIHPVKSLGILPLEEAALDPCGLANDRRWLVTTPDGIFLTQRELPAMALISARPAAGGLTLATPGHTPLTVPNPDADAPQLTVRVWRDHVPARLASPHAAAWLSAVLGQDVRLVHLHDPAARPADPAFAPGAAVSFADGFALLVTTTASLAALNQALAEAGAAPVSQDRFRPNLVIANTTPWEEAGWQRLRIGAVTLRLVKPCERCIVTTIDPATATRPDKSEPLRTLARLNPAGQGVVFGQNAVPELPLPPGATLRRGDAVAVA